MSYYNAILIETYTRPTQQCHFEWLWVTLSDLAKWQEALHDLSATAELLVLLLFVSVLLLWINSTIRRLTNLTCRRTWSRSLLRCCCCCCWLISRIPVWLTDSRLTSGCWRPPYAKHLGVTTSSLQQLDATESCCWQKKTVITSESAVAAAVYSVRASSGPGTGACALPQLCTVWYNKV